MNKNILIIILILITGGLVYYFGFYEKALEEKPGESQLANPAAIYCEEQEGTLESVMFEAGVRTSCVFIDDSECNQWDFYNGKCKKGELKKEILEEGTGKRANNGDIVIVHYIGMLEDKTKFDSSIDKGQPFSFTLGLGKVIQGWEQGVLGMQVGEKRKLTIDSRLAYGEAGIPGTIPPNAILIFEIELLEIQ